MTKRKHFNSLPEFSETQNINVDREQSILKNVEIAKFGKNKNYTYFNQKFIDDLVLKGNEQKQGVKSRFGHPAMCGNSLGTYIGRFKNFSQKDGKVYSDLHLDPISKKTQVEGKGITMYDYIMDMAENNPDMFGNSIVVSCYTFDEEVQNEAGEKETVESLILEEFVSSDLVDDPAATDALFSSNPNDLGVIVSTFLDSNPKVFDVIGKNPMIIGDFFERYANYSKRNSNPLNMSFLKNLKKAFSNSNFDIDVTLADGSIVTVITEAEQPAVGDQVNDSEGNPVVEGEHLLPDGTSIVTDASGIITELKEKEEEPTGEGDSEFAKKFDAFTKKFDTYVASNKKTQSENEEAFGLISKSFQGLEKKVALMGKSITSQKPGNHSSENNGGPKPNSKPGAYDSAKAKEHHNKTK